MQVFENATFYTFLLIVVVILAAELWLIVKQRKALKAEREGVQPGKIVAKELTEEEVDRRLFFGVREKLKGLQESGDGAGARSQSLEILANDIAENEKRLSRRDKAMDAAKKSDRLMCGDASFWMVLTRQNIEDRVCHFESMNYVILPDGYLAVNVELETVLELVVSGGGVEKNDWRNVVTGERYRF